MRMWTPIAAEGTEALEVPNRGCLVKIRGYNSEPALAWIPGVSLAELRGVKPEPREPPPPTPAPGLGRLGSFP